MSARQSSAVAAVCTTLQVPRSSLPARYAAKCRAVGLSCRGAARNPYGCRAG
jgi:hypothetical protein